MGYHYKELTGQRFGRLVALERLPERIGHYKAVAWKCQCDCGVIKPIARGELTSGNTQSCGCLFKELVSSRKRIRPYEALYNNCAKVAKGRGLDFSISYEEFVELTDQKNCHYCDSEITWSKVNIGLNGPAHNLDRKDNTKGYSLENCLISCGICNCMKRALPYDVFIEHIRKIEQCTRGK